MKEYLLTIRCIDSLEIFHYIESFEDDIDKEEIAFCVKLRFYELQSKKGHPCELLRVNEITGLN